MRKVLKTADAPLITSECWTYYKMLVFQTMEGFESWLITHLKLFLYDNGHATFGEDGDMYRLWYFSDVLNIEDGNILSVGKSQIIDVLIDCINKDKYIVLDLNFDGLFRPAKGSFEHNEPIIYGYDLEKEVFIASVLLKGTFKEVYLKFANVEASFGDMLEYYQSDPKRFFERKRWYFGITLFSAKDCYTNANEEYDLKERLEWELSGTVYKKSYFGASKEQAYFTGLSAVKKFYDVLSSALNAEELNDYDLKQWHRTCMKLHEREKILLCLISYYLEKKHISDTQGLLSAFEQCCEVLERNVLLFYKYTFTGDKRILERIVNVLPNVIHLEKQALENCVQLIYMKNER